MDKKKVEDYLEKAYLVLRETYELDGLVSFKFCDEKGTIKKAFRSQISSFGAAVQMGSLKTAVAFFSKKGNSEVRRDALMIAIYRIIVPEGREELFSFVNANNNFETKEKILSAAVALKLAMNLYHLE
ncbi:MAG: hypothetical protein ACRCU3_11020 [Eubacteriaceae bacterium]